MAFPWHPITSKPGWYTCTEHGGEWSRGNRCSQCPVGSVAYGQTGSEAEQLAKAAAERGLPSVLDHEQWFMGVSAKAEALADKLAKPPRASRAKTKAGRARAAANASAGGGAIAVQRLLETAIKARARAAALTEWREDWARTERLRKLSMRLGGVGRAGQVATQDPASGAN